MNSRRCPTLYSKQYLCGHIPFTTSPDEQPTTTTVCVSSGRKREGFFPGHQQGNRHQLVRVWQRDRGEVRGFIASQKVSPQQACSAYEGMCMTQQPHPSSGDEFEMKLLHAQGIAILHVFATHPLSITGPSRCPMTPQGTPRSSSLVCTSWSRMYLMVNQLW